MRKFIFYQILCFVLFNVLGLEAKLYASPFSWADSIGGIGTGTGTSVTTDQNNNIYVCGQLNGIFQPGATKIKGNNGFIARYSNAGSLKWAIPLPGLFCKSISMDAYQNACVTGYFSGIIYLGAEMLKSAGLNDFFILKFDSLGNLIWHVTGGGLGNDYGFSVSNDLKGNTYITGSFEDYINFNANNSILSLGKSDVFVVAYDSAGKFIWAQNGGGSGEDAGISVKVDLDGNVFVAGYFNGKAAFRSNIIQSRGSRNIFIAKYSYLGFQLNVYTAGGAGDAIPADMGLDGSGNVYLAGSYTGTAGFGNKSITAANRDGYIAAYDNNLNIKWLYSIGGPGDDAALGIKSDWQSNVFLTGVFTGTADFNGHSLNSSGLTDIFILKYDAAGRMLWAEKAGGTGADSAFSVTNDYNDIASVTGAIGTESYFGNIRLGADSGGSFFISQLQSDPAGLFVQQTHGSGITIYPNPSGGICYIESIETLKSPMNIMISDLAGRIVLAKNEIRTQKTSFDLTNEPDGIYIMAIKNETGIYSLKLIKTSH